MLFNKLQALGRVTLAIGVTMTISTTAFADPPPAAPRSGKFRLETAQLGGEAIRVYVYEPKSCSPERLLILLPGFERNAEFYARRARKLAKSACFTVIAPEFDQERFPRRRYQRAGIRGRRGGEDLNGCTGVLLRQLLNWSREHTRMPEAPYYIFGHSAGAQLLSRVTAFCPMPGPERIIIANPSTHVAASLTDRLPFGFGGILDIRLREQLLEAYLSQPITIYLGEKDTGIEHLDTSATAMRQGRTRVERGGNVYQAAKQYAGLRGWAFNWRLVIASGVGHTSRGMLHAPQVMDAFALRPDTTVRSGAGSP